MEDKYKNPSRIIHCRRYVYNFHFHLVWVTKYRNKIFNTPQLVRDMKHLLKHIATRCASFSAYKYKKSQLRL